MCIRDRYLNVRRSAKSGWGWVPISIYTAWVTVAALANMAILVTRALDGGIAFFNGLSVVALTAVSYTHLDVYKRQELACDSLDIDTIAQSLHGLKGEVDKNPQTAAIILAGGTGEMCIRDR